MKEAILTTLRIAKKAPTDRRNKAMLFMYNRQPWCGGGFGQTAYGLEVIETTTAANRERIKIHVMHVPEWTHEQGDDFGKALAAANNGKFTRYVESGFNN